MLKRVIFIFFCFSYLMIFACPVHAVYSYCPGEFKAGAEYPGWTAIFDSENEASLPLVEVVAMENIINPVTCAYKLPNMLFPAMLMTFGATVRIGGEFIPHWGYGSIDQGFRCDPRFRCDPQNNDPTYCPFQKTYD